MLVLSLHRLEDDTELELSFVEVKVEALVNAIGTCNF